VVQKSSPSKKFSEMTEEEKIEWAKNYTWKPRKRANPGSLTRSSRSKIIKKSFYKAKDEKRYNDPERRAKTFGAAYNERIRYLYTYNKKYNELKKFRIAYRLYKNKRNTYNGWRHTYYQEYKGRLSEYASTFKLEGQELYLLGFSLSDLAKYAPFSFRLLRAFIDIELFPVAKYVGYKFKQKKMNSETETFYLVSEVEEFLSVCASFEAKYKQVKDSNEKYLKKQLWTRMLKARKEFDDRN
jgi:hypothetical protein